MKKYTRLDGGGLLFLSQQLKKQIDNSAVTVDSIISADSTNDCAAGSRAVYDLVTAAASECVQAVDMQAVSDTEIAEIAKRVWG